MNWEILGAVGELLGTFVVFVSLGYLALQKKHSNTQARLEAVRVSTGNWVAQHQAAFATEDDVAFMRRAMADFESLSPDEQGRFFGVMTGYFAAFDSLYKLVRAPMA